MIFFVKGMWGKTFSQIFLFVLSLRLAAFFINNFNLKIFLLLSLSGWVKIKPACPKFNFTFLEAKEVVLIF